MSKNKNRRPQQAKDNREMMHAFQELRKGSRCEPIPSGKVYSRKQKHKEW